MNVLLCAQVLSLILDPSAWTECVLGHQNPEKEVCICRIENLRSSKCLRISTCEVKNPFLILLKIPL